MIPGGWNRQREASNNQQDSGSVEDFFDGLETQVNGGIVDQQSEQVTPEFNGPQETRSQETTQIQTQESNNTVDWEKRYKDSSREATKMREELNRLSPFTPVLEAMETDNGLVDHVRDYFGCDRHARRAYPSILPRIAEVWHHRCNAGR